MEMPYPRGVYKDKVDNEMPQILINWCLVHYCTIINREQLKKHWKGELRGHILTMSRHSIKGNDAPEKRQKVFDEIWYENDYSNPQMMNMAICNKFIEEGIDIQSKEYATTIIDCIQNIQDLFNVVLSRDISAITQYVETI